ncbi:MAG TPA: DUF6636 domain-containing protein [Solirubrobacterales bacterium]|nr:DUF6636 domain-containing protein [Solirubrobacterales bacterium]
MKLAAPAALVVVLAALVAGCGGGGTTTVIRTITEKVAVEENGSGGTTETAAQQEAAEKKAEEASEPSRIVHLKTFRSPSGNIGCALYEGGARCDIRKRDWSPPPRPAQCPEQVDYGQGIEVAHRGEAGFVCAGDTALDPSASALSYGTASQVGGAECISRKNGVTCVNQAGHGFFLSVQSYQVF